MLAERSVIIATTPGTRSLPVTTFCKIPSHALFKLLPIDVPPLPSLIPPFAPNEPMERVEVGFQSDCLDAGCANENPTAAVTAIATGVLRMSGLQVSITFRPSFLKRRPFSCDRP